MATQISVRLDGLSRTTNQLQAMNKRDFAAYINDVDDFLAEMQTTSTTDPQAEADAETEDAKALQGKAEVIAKRVENEKFRRSWRGMLGMAQKTKPPAAEVESPLEPTPEEELARFNAELEKIKKIRLDKAAADYAPERVANKSGSILASAVDEFRHALIPPLLDVDVVELQEKRDALDAAKAVANIYNADGKNVRSLLDKLKRVSTGAASVLSEFTEETTGGVFKATALFLGWPLILPVKIANIASGAAKYAFCAADGALGFIDKGLDGLIGDMERSEDGKFIMNTENVIKGIAHVALRGIPVVMRGCCQAAAIGCRWLERNIDADKWLKHAPVTSGFAIGGVGAAVLITVSIASVFSFGIPIAMLALGFAVATVGALAHGYFKGKARAAELTSLQLDAGDTTKLGKYERDHQHPAPKPTVKKQQEIQAAVLAPAHGEKAEAAAAVRPSPPAQEAAADVAKPSINKDALLEARQGYTPGVFLGAAGAEKESDDKSGPRNKRRRMDE